MTMVRHVERSKEPKPTDGLYHNVRVDFDDGTGSGFIARFDLDEQFWFLPEGSMIWPTSWDPQPCADQGGGGQSTLGC